MKNYNGLIVPAITVALGAMWYGVFNYFEVDDALGVVPTGVGSLALGYITLWAGINATLFVLYKTKYPDGIPMGIGSED